MIIGRSFIVWIVALVSFLIMSLCAGHIWNTPLEVIDSQYTYMDNGGGYGTSMPGQEFYLGLKYSF